MNYLETELKTLKNLNNTKKRTISIYVVSAVSIYYKSGRFLESVKLAKKYLASDKLLGFARTELNTILQDIEIMQYLALCGIYPLQ